MENKHFFLGEGHIANERRTWAVIALCGVMMALEIGGGLIFGSVALVADGIHMSTHAGALLIAAAAYTYARRHAQDPRFSWGTGKLGDLAGFTSALILAMVALLIAVEAILHLSRPGQIDFAEAIPIAVLGLAVNVASAILLGGDHHHHDHHDHDHHHHDHDHDHDHHHARDNNMRAAFAHVIADAAVSVLVIVALLLARAFGWMWLDPLAGLVGAVVIASWAWTLIRDTGAVLLDMNPDQHLYQRMQRMVEQQGDIVADLHVWRIGPGHLGAVLCVASAQGSTVQLYREKLAGFGALSHVTVEIISELPRAA